MAEASASDPSVQLRVFMDKEKKKVLYAEAGKDFVDILFSFFTLPLGTIVRLVAKESNIEAVKVGSLSSLYQSVANLDEQYLWTPTCKEMLLNPRNSMEDYCQCMKLNIDDTETTKYFTCVNWSCNRRDSGSLLSIFKNQKCFCGNVMDSQIFPEYLDLKNGFVKETATFIISDDLRIMPNLFGTFVDLFQKLGVNGNDTIPEQTVDITKTKVIDLLKLSLISKTPLTDFIFNKKPFLSNLNPGLEIKNVISPKDDGKLMNLKVMVRKSNGEIVFAEAEEDFADFLFSFLTFPLGGVLHMLEGYPSLGCLNNMYQSMKELNPERYFISPDLNGKLTKPQISRQFEVTNQILPICSATLPVYYCHTYYKKKHSYVVLTNDMVYTNKNYSIFPQKCVPFSFVDPKFSSSKPSSSGEFAKGPSTYMVTDDLVVTPMSYPSAMYYLNRSKVSLIELEEKVIKIGVKEGLAILASSLISASALTNGLNQLIRKIKEPVTTIKMEK